MDAFGACHTRLCEWGNVPATSYGATVSSVTGNSFQAGWNPGFARRVMLARLTRPGGVPTLVVKELTTFIPPDGRSNYTETYRFVQARHRITPKASGKPSSGYPLGEWVRPVKALLGTWTNKDSHGLAKIRLTRNPDGSLRVRVFGRCQPALCDWGVVQGVTFGDSTASVRGRAFLAHYRFSFKTVLLSGSVNAAGTTLTVRDYSRFAPRDSRSNYTHTSTFRRARPRLTVYVTNSASGTVTPITTATGTAGTPITVGSEPTAVAVTPNGKTAYVANLGSGTVTPIRTATRTAGHPITIGRRPFAIAVTPNGKTAYVVSFTTGTVIPIRTATNTAGRPIQVGKNPIAIAISPNGRTAYVSNYGAGTVTPIRTATNTAGSPIAVGTDPHPLAITPNGRTVYVGNEGSDTVTPIRTATGTAGPPIAVGSAPYAMAIG
ncbi:MAG TPA: YncE family protein [Nakamurella sp.]